MNEKIIEPVFQTTEDVQGKPVSFCLWPDGKFTADMVEKPWFKNDNNKPCIPAKRKTFRTLVKASIKEGDFNE